MSIVRENLLKRKGYTPYCGGEYNICRLPRTVFDGAQFKCPHCNFRTGFEPEFIAEYVKAQSGELKP